MTEEKNINATAEKNKSADELLSDDELENVAGGTGGKMYEPFGRGRHDYDDDLGGGGGTGKLTPPVPGHTGK